ncbi:NUDIX hydrolase [Macrococcus sp. DPC7161]|uniref:NUDIX hydrolase n=1 Tax=Macrococcus sp. DPC7161 TaxID=2507060 RepID=UPI00100C2055|nr:NUDIX hydrolase [Macrococcus sp. DPC7161]RXK19178.1 NUDIX hydrolase [Macrococcus sp. DPC7161]
MIHWHGASAIVIDNSKLLIVKSKTEQKWTIPTGGLETDETSEQACIREVLEETGYDVKILKYIESKDKSVKNYQVKVDYYLCSVISGELIINDPDEEIDEIRWVSNREFNELDWLYPEDTFMIKQYIGE